jgi:hypothetical protein
MYSASTLSWLNMARDRGIGLNVDMYASPDGHLASKFLHSTHLSPLPIRNHLNLTFSLYSFRSNGEGAAPAGGAVRLSRRGGEAAARHDAGGPVARRGTSTRSSSAKPSRSSSACAPWHARSPASYPPRRGVGVSHPSAPSPPPDVEQDDPTPGPGAAPVASPSLSPCPWERRR